MSRGSHFNSQASGFYPVGILVALVLLAKQHQGYSIDSKVGIEHGNLAREELWPSGLSAPVDWGLRCTQRFSFSACGLALEFPDPSRLFALLQNF